MSVSLVHEERFFRPVPRDSPLRRPVDISHARGYVGPVTKIPTSVFRMMLWLIAGMGIAVVVLFALYWSQGQTLQRDNQFKNTQIQNLQEQVLQLQLKVDELGR